jgi:ATP-dependent exoDNAse (exonuclease V) beta subunit
VAWNQIGLLFRSGTDWEVYLDALRRARVPFAVEGDRSYYERREVLEASAFLRLVLDPNDQMALVTWLRSALVGVPDAALFPLWREQLPDRLRELHGPGGGAALAGPVQRAAAATPRDVPGIERVDGWWDNLLAAVETLGRLRALFDEEPADVFVEGLRGVLLVEATEAARYLGPYRAANLDRFFRDLLASLARGDGDPQAVIRTLREDVAARREHEEGRPREAIEDAVQVLTIHKAKGLDFEHVYLLQAHKGHGGREPEKAQLEGGRLELHMLGARTLLWHRVRTRRERVEDAERRRTWYVALTRAKRRLVVAAKWPPPGKSAAGYAELLALRGGGAPDLEEAMADCAAAGGCAVLHGGVRFVFPALPAAWEASAERPLPRPARPPALERIVEEASRLGEERAAAAARMERPFSRAVSHSAHEALREAWRSRRESDEEDRAAGSGAFERDAAMAAGTAVHRALERLDPGLEAGAARERLGEALGDELISSLAPAARDAARARAGALLERFLAGPLYVRWCRLAEHIVARELPVLLPPDDDPEDPENPVGFVAGAIDLVYEDPDGGGLVVADYKTDRIESSAEMEAKAERYASQGAGYVRALEEALGLDAPPRFELWFLDADEVREVRPAD